MYVEVESYRFHLELINGERERLRIGRGTGQGGSSCVWGDDGGRHMKYTPRRFDEDQPEGGDCVYTEVQRRRNLRTR